MLLQQVGLMRASSSSILVLDTEIAHLQFHNLPEKEKKNTMNQMRNL